MRAAHTSDGVVVSMSVAEAVVLHVMSDVQQALTLLIPTLGSEEYGSVTFRSNYVARVLHSSHECERFAHREPLPA